MRQVHQRFLVEWMFMFLLLPSATVWLDSKPGLADANAVLYDRIQRNQPSTPSSDILIIGIDKRTITALGPWPFARSVHAQLLDRLTSHSPRAVLLDIFFDEPAADPKHDQQLADAMSRLPVYLPLNYQKPSSTQTDSLPTFTPPIPELAIHARGIGHANATPDPDGLVREIWRYEGSENQIWPYIGLVIAQNDLAIESVPPPVDNGRGRIRQQRFGVPFAGPAGTYPTVSYLDVFRGNLSDEMLRGKLILVGALADSGLGDTMPVAGIGALTSLPGVEIHANALDALLNNQGIDMPSDTRRVLWISIPIWLALVLFLRNASHAVTITLLIGAACVAANYALLVYGRLGLPLASPLCGIVLAYLLWSWRRLDALLVFFRQRAAALNAVPAGAFEPPEQPEQVPLDSVERRTHDLDRAIDRLTRLQSLLTEGVWQLPIPVLICRMDGVVSQSNAAAQALLSVTPMSTSQGLTNADDQLRGVDLPRLLEKLSKVALPDVPSDSARTPWTSAMSSEFTTRQGNIFRLRAAPLSNAVDAAAHGWVVVLPDVTTERRAQREREQWFGFLSHDLRSPQVTIISLLSLYAEGAPNIDIHGLMAGIEGEARRTIHLAESFMEMVEAESGIYQFALTIAGSVVLDAIDATWAAAQAVELTVKPRLSTSDCSIVADSSLLTRALVNLLTNAIRSSVKGSTIYVCLEAGPYGDDGHAEALISVQDGGSGMDEDQIAKVMQTGTRRKKATLGGPHRTGQGWGVGLSIVHAVIARHGGWIDVVSAPGAGTTFFIGLPLAADDPADAT